MWEKTFGGNIYICICVCVWMVCWIEWDRKMVLAMQRYAKNVYPRYKLPSMQLGIQTKPVF